MSELHMALVSNHRVVSLKTVMNVGIPHSHVLRLQKSLDRNKRLARDSLYPRLILDRHSLKRHSVNWRAELEQVNDRISEVADGKVATERMAQRLKWQIEGHLQSAADNAYSNEEIAELYEESEKLAEVMAQLD